VQSEAVHLPGLLRDQTLYAPQMAALANRGPFSVSNFSQYAIDGTTERLCSFT